MKKRYLFFIGFLILFTPICVKAENKIYFQNDTMDVMPGVTYKVYLKVDSDELFTRVDFDVISLSDKVILSKIRINDSFTNNSDYGYSLVSDTSKKSGTSVATVYFKIDDSAEVGETAEIKATDVSLVSDDTYYLDNASIVLKVKEKNSNELASLSSKIAPFEFDKKKLNYEVKVKEDVNKFDLVATPEDPNAKVYISNQKLELRKNTIMVRVSKEGLNDKTYRVVVIKDIKEDNSSKIIKDNSADKEKSNAIKRNWVLVLSALSLILIMDIFFLIKKKIDK